MKEKKEKLEEKTVCKEKKKEIIEVRPNIFTPQDIRLEGIFGSERSNWPEECKLGQGNGIWEVRWMRSAAQRSLSGRQVAECELGEWDGKHKSEGSGPPGRQTAWGVWDKEQ